MRNEITEYYFYQTLSLYDPEGIHSPPPSSSQPIIRDFCPIFLQLPIFKNTLMLMHILSNTLWHTQPHIHAFAWTWTDNSTQFYSHKSTSWLVSTLFWFKYTHKNDMAHPGEIHRDSWFKERGWLKKFQCMKIIIVL